MRTLDAWLDEAVLQLTTPLPAVPDVTWVKNVTTGLKTLRRALELRHDRQGAMLLSMMMLSAISLADLRSALTERDVEARCREAEHLLREVLAQLSGAPPPPRGLWRSWFGPTLPRIAPDRALAELLSSELPGPMWLQLLEKSSPALSEVLVAAPPNAPDVWPPLLERAQRARDAAGRRAALAPLLPLDPRLGPEATDASLVRLLATETDRATRDVMLTLVARQSASAAVPLMVERTDTLTLLRAPEVAFDHLEIIKRFANFPGDEELGLALARALSRAPQLEMFAASRLCELLPQVGPSVRAELWALVDRHEVSHDDVLFSMTRLAARDDELGALARARLLTLRGDEYLQRDALNLLAQAHVASTPGSALQTTLAEILSSRRLLQPPSGVPIETALSAQLDANPDDEGHWRVLVDALLERGDVRGDAAVSGGVSGAPARPLVEKLFADVERVLPPGALEPLLHSMTWRHGFVRALTVTETTLRTEDETDLEPDGERRLVALLATPALRFVEQLTLESLGELELALTVIATSPARASLRRLRLGTEDQRLGDVSVAFSLPRLTHLTLVGQPWLSTDVRSPALRQLVLQTGALGETFLERLGELNPPLEEVTLAPPEGRDASATLTALRTALPRVKVTAR